MKRLNLYSKCIDLYIKQHVSGIFFLNVFLYDVIDILNKQLSEMMEDLNFENVLLPILTNKKLLIQSKRTKEFLNEMFTCKDSKFALSPTCEETSLQLVSPVFKKNLSIKIFQISRKFRKEKRPQGLLYRTKEFIMKDGYSFHKNKKDLKDTYKEVKQMYKDFFTLLKIPFYISTLKKDENMKSGLCDEFWFIHKQGSTKIQQCIVCNVINCFKHNQNQEKNAIEIGHIFELNTYFSKTLNISFSDDNKKSWIYMGCYGIGISRLFMVLMYEFFDTNKEIFTLPKFFENKRLCVIYDDGLKLDENLKLYLKKLKKNTGIKIYHFNK